MNVGYSFWGYLGDYKFDKNLKEVSTPDGNAFYSWSIVKSLQEKGDKVYFLMPDRDEVGYRKMGKDLFGSWCTNERNEAYNEAIKVKYDENIAFDLNIKLRNAIEKLDFILLEWRFKIEGRNFGEVYTQPDWYIQDRILKIAKSIGKPVIVFDLDYKLEVEDIAEYGIKSIIELGDKWSGKYCKRVEIPFYFKSINEFEVVNGKGIVYVGNRYERDKSVEKYLAKVNGCEVYGNWNESGRNSSNEWPNIKFMPRIAARDMRNAYKEKNATVLLAKDDYYKFGFMTARIIEAVFYGVVPVFPEEFGEEVIRKYAGCYKELLTVKNYKDVEAIGRLQSNMKKEIVKYLRNHLIFMDSSLFVNKITEIARRMENEKV